MTDETIARNGEYVVNQHERDGSVSINTLDDLPTVWFPAEDIDQVIEVLEDAQESLDE